MIKRPWRSLLLVMMAALCLCGYDMRTPSMVVTFTDEEGIVHHFHHDLEHAATETLDDQELVGYPTAVPAEGGRIIYYTSRDGDGRMQLFSLNKETQQRKQLSTQFANVDVLRLDEDGETLYMRVTQPGHENHQIAVYTISSGQLQVWNPEEKDLSVKWFDYDRADSQVLAWTVSLAEESERLRKAQKEPETVEPATHRLMRYQEGEPGGEEVCTVNLDVLDLSISSDGEHALFAAAESLAEDAKNTIYHIDLTTGKRLAVFTETPAYRKIRQPQYALAGTGIYFLAIKGEAQPTVDKQGYETQPRAVCHYDFKTKGLTEVWFRQHGTINNYQILD